MVVCGRRKAWTQKLLLQQQDRVKRVMMMMMAMEGRQRKKEKCGRGIALVVAVAAGCAFIGLVWFFLLPVSYGLCVYNNN